MQNNSYIITVDNNLLFSILCKTDIEQEDIKDAFNFLLYKGINTFNFEGFNNLNKYSDIIHEINRSNSDFNIIKETRSDAKNKKLNFDYRYYGSLKEDFTTLLPNKF